MVNTCNARRSIGAVDRLIAWREVHLREKTLWRMLLSRLLRGPPLRAGARHPPPLGAREEKLLKAAFPLDVRADNSSAEIPFGHVPRPTHANTSWDAAKFEICAHRFLHPGERGWGAAVVNHSTYGHEVTRDVRADGCSTYHRPAFAAPRTSLPRPLRRSGAAPSAR